MSKLVGLNENCSCLALRKTGYPPKNATLSTFQTDEVTGFDVTQAGRMEADFSIMYMLEPYCRIRRSYQPGIWCRLKLSAHTFTLAAIIHKLQIDNQQVRRVREGK